MMTEFESIEDLMRHQLAAKERRRKQLAALPIEEKLAILERMQRTGRELARIREAAKQERKA